MASPLKSSPVYARAKEYERGIDIAHMDREGIFYTPLSLVQEMVVKGLEKRGKCSTPAILDPSCGAGIFLLAAFDELLQRYDMPTAHAGDTILASQLYGIDKDREAVTLCLSLLAQRYREWFGKEPSSRVQQLLRAHLIHADTLLDDTLFNTRFDLVIGNPPYGLSRDGKLSPAENKALKARYAEIRNGKLDKYVAFIAKGFSLCAPHGVLSFVVPNSWLGIRSGKGIRKLLLGTGSLREIHTFEERIFEVPGVEAIVFYAVKDSPSPTFTVSRRSKEKTSSFTLVTKTCLAAPDSLIPLVWDEALEEIFGQIDTDAFFLGDEDSPFSPLIALQAYSEGKGSPPQTREQVKGHVFHSPICTGEDSYPYLEGKDIGRYFQNSHRSWLKYGPWLSEFQPLERFQGPRIAIREIVGALPKIAHATLVENTALYNRSILHIVPRSGTTKDDLLILLGVLNSPLGSLILHYRGRKTQRTLFPKIVNDDLKAFPLSKKFRERGAAIPTLILELISKTSSQTQLLEEKINSLVFDIFTLTKSQREKVLALVGNAGEINSL